MIFEVACGSNPVLGDANQVERVDVQQPEGGRLQPRLRAQFSHELRPAEEAARNGAMTFARRYTAFLQPTADALLVTLHGGLVRELFFLCHGEEIPENEGPFSIMVLFLSDIEPF